MSDAPKFSAELQTLCGKLREGEITQAESERLSAILLESRSARRFYRSFMALASALETRASMQDTIDKDGDADSNIEVLFELLRQEQQAEVIAYPSQSDSASQGKESLAWDDLANASGYLLTHGLKSNVTKWLAAAAVILLAVSLFAVFNSGNNDIAPIASEEPADDEPVASPQPVVATLTAEHHALWDTASAEGALALGAPLRAGDRFTLTAGFAEITTRDGAIAILEAPATIELIDHNNAIRLHAGKLVGICETESSKGFLVRTPHMDVTDLGTRFGIDATLQEMTQIHVFDGKVQVRSSAPSQESESPLNLLAGQAVASSEAQGLADAAYDERRFVPDMVAASLVPDFAGTNAVWLGQLSGDLSQDMREADALQVFLEQEGVMLEQDITVDFNLAHAWVPQGETGLYRIEAGERVDVYLLHFDMKTGHIEAEDLLVDFARPILGVIVSQATLDQTDASLGVMGVTYPEFKDNPNEIDSGPRGLNNRTAQALDALGLDTSRNDLASLSSDGTKLSLRLWGGEANTNAKMDQVRVLVRSDRDFGNR